MVIMEQSQWARELYLQGILVASVSFEALNYFAIYSKA